MSIGLPSCAAPALRRAPATQGRAALTFKASSCLCLYLLDLEGMDYELSRFAGLSFEGILSV